MSNRCDFYLLLDILTNFYYNYVQPPPATAVTLLNTTLPTTTTRNHFGRFEPRERTGYCSAYEQGHRRGELPSVACCSRCLVMSRYRGLSGQKRKSASCSRHGTKVRPGGQRVTSGYGSSLPCVNRDVLLHTPFQEL